MNIRHFFSEEQRASIQKSIEDAEKLTSGEIRVHIQKHCGEDPLADAALVFHSLKMDATEERNGVLIFIALNDRKLAILGDKGINEKVPAGFWDQAYSLMRREFHQGRYTEGLQAAIAMAAEQLQHYFPFHPTDRNELHNDISYGE